MTSLNVLLLFSSRKDFLLALLFVFIVTVIVLSINYFFNKKVISNKQGKTEETISEERKRLLSIFEGAGLGIVVYGPNGNLQMADSQLTNLLGIEKTPLTFEDFLNEFGLENGLKATYLLGSQFGESDLIVGDKNLHVQYSLIKKGNTDENFWTISKSQGAVIFVRDISDEIEEDIERKKFVANVSHELKTPITVLKIYAETLLDWGLAEKSSDAVRKDVENILENALRMESLVEDLLLLSKIDSRGRTLRTRELDIVSLLSTIVEQSRVQAEEKNITLEFHTVSKIPAVLGDESSLGRVFSNLITNAIKYTDKGGRVDIYISRVINDIVIKVKDNGLGISEKDQKKIFDRFYRVDQTGSREYGGTGLGLSIAKELVELHKGKLSVNSILTYGSEFVVSLPIASKIYMQVIDNLEFEKDKNRTGRNTESLNYAAYEFLLERAHQIGIAKESLEDLSDEEKLILAEPYIKERKDFSRKKIDVAKKNNDTNLETKVEVEAISTEENTNSGSEDQDLSQNNKAQEENNTDNTTELDQNESEGAHAAEDDKYAMELDPVKENQEIEADEDKSDPNEKTSDIESLGQ